MPESPPPSWYDPPMGHLPECKCERCHDGHVEADEVEDNAKRPDYECCRGQIEIWIQAGYWCPKNKHGRLSMDLTQKGLCHECEEKGEDGKEPGPALHVPQA